MIRTPSSHARSVLIRAPGASIGVRLLALVMGVLVLGTQGAGFLRASSTGSAGQASAAPSVLVRSAAIVTGQQAAGRLTGSPLAKPQMLVHDQRSSCGRHAVDPQGDAQPILGSATGTPALASGHGEALVGTRSSGSWSPPAPVLTASRAPPGA